MTTTVTNKPVPVATRAHGDGVSTIYAVRAYHDVGHSACGLRVYNYVRDRRQEIFGFAR